MFADESSWVERTLIAKAGSWDAADSLLDQVAYDLGVRNDRSRALVALALLKMNVDLERIARSLTWGDFEEFCDKALKASGYATKRNIVLRKPRRQIDIVAESQTLVLSIDCKHWNKTVGVFGLEKVASAQIERTLHLKASTKESEKTFLPMLVTLLDNQFRAVNGVPVVPLLALRAFLSSVSRFDQGFHFL